MDYKPSKLINYGCTEYNLDLMAVIVITMTAIISVKLFRQEDSHSHRHANDNVLKIGGEQEELFVSNQDS